MALHKFSNIPNVVHNVCNLVPIIHGTHKQSYRGPEQPPKAA
jgi:hypothetical protein